MTSLNPVLAPGTSSSSPCGCTRAWAAPARAGAWAARQVGLPEPRRRLDGYPHELGGHAAAGDHRHGNRMRAEAAHRRRADHGARRHDPAADRAARPAEGRGPHEHAVHQPRPRRGGRNRRPGGGDARRQGARAGPVARIFAARPTPIPARCWPAGRRSTPAPRGCRWSASRLPTRRRRPSRCLAAPAMAAATTATSARRRRRARRRRGPRSGEKLLAAPGHVRPPRIQGGRSQRRRRQLHAAPRPHARRRRRVGLGQDHDGAGAAAAARARRRTGRR